MVERQSSCEGSRQVGGSGATVGRVWGGVVLSVTAGPTSSGGVTAERISSGGVTVERISSGGVNV